MEIVLNKITKINLTEEKETLLITLYAKALESQLINWIKS